MSESVQIQSFLLAISGMESQQRLHNTLKVSKHSDFFNRCEETQIKGADDKCILNVVPFPDLHLMTGVLTVPAPIKGVPIIQKLFFLALRLSHKKDIKNVF